MFFSVVDNLITKEQKTATAIIMKFFCVWYLYQEVEKAGKRNKNKAA